MTSSSSEQVSSSSMASPSPAKSYSPARNTTKQYVTKQSSASSDTPKQSSDVTGNITFFPSPL